MVSSARPPVILGVSPNGGAEAEVLRPINSHIETATVATEPCLITFLVREIAGLLVEGR